MPGDSRGTQQTVNVSDPWSAQQPFLRAGFQEAANQFAMPGPEYYPNSTVTPMSSATNQSLQRMEGRSLAGSPLLQAGQGETQKTLSGDYLREGNPYMQGVMDKVMSTVVPGVQSRFNMSGRSGSNAEMDTMTRAVSESIAPYAYGSYESERGRMGSAASAAPGMAAADYTDIAQQGAVGAAREAQADAELKDNVARFDYGQTLPQRKLADFMALVRGNFGGTQTTTQPVYKNTAANVAGGALSAAALAKMLNLV
jgi:hypothetical protein